VRVGGEIFKLYMTSFVIIYIYNDLSGLGSCESRDKHVLKSMTLIKDEHTISGHDSTRGGGVSGGRSTQEQIRPTGGPLQQPGQTHGYCRLTYVHCFVMHQ